MNTLKTSFLSITRHSFYPPGRITLMSSQDSKLIWQMLKLWQMHEFAIGHRHLKDGTALQIFHLTIRSFLLIREVTLKNSSRKCASIIWHLTTWRKSLQLWILRTNYSIILYATWMSDGSCNICSNIIWFFDSCDKQKKIYRMICIEYQLEIAEVSRWMNILQKVCHTCNSDSTPLNLS